MNTTVIVFSQHNQLNTITIIKRSFKFTKLDTRFKSFHVSIVHRDRNLTLPLKSRVLLHRLISLCILSRAEALDWNWETMWSRGSTRNRQHSSILKSPLRMNWGWTIRPLEDDVLQPLSEAIDCCSTCPLTGDAPLWFMTSILCYYINRSRFIQQVRLQQNPYLSLDRIVFPGEKLMFEGLPEELLEIYTYTASGLQLLQTIACEQLQVLHRQQAELET